MLFISYIKNGRFCIKLYIRILDTLVVVAKRGAMRTKSVENWDISLNRDVCDTLGNRGNKDNP